MRPSSFALISAPAPPKQPSMRRSWPSASAEPATTLPARSPALQACNYRSAATWLRCHASKALTFQRSSSLAQRRGGELRRDLEAVLHAHGSRSDQIGDIVAARGLEPYF